MNKKDRETHKGINFYEMLTVLFIGLKLTGHITWSWWWVLSPFWIPYIILFVVAMILYIKKQ
ncbi:hypothetical protein ACDH46_04500 [Aerococcaceae bacterium zg-1292]|uniref:hypothetical protein n=1 Tax=Aerococcaceae bacterium zg-1292 TaxID=2774330 RepID=UPI0019A7E340|nr:hypothetical protein [Aerococcaceae bacterium zg-1292]